MNPDICLEEYCNMCDNPEHIVFNADDLDNFKVGLIKCHCGELIRPCNYCNNRYPCGDNYANLCPWNKAKITNAMDDVDYLEWIKKYEPECYVHYKDGTCGDYYKELVEKIENNH